MNTSPRLVEDMTESFSRPWYSFCIMPACVGALMRGWAGTSRLTSRELERSRWPEVCEPSKKKGHRSISQWTWRGLQAETK